MVYTLFGVNMAKDTNVTMDLGLSYVIIMIIPLRSEILGGSGSIGTGARTNDLQMADRLNQSQLPDLADCSTKSESIDTN
jgi:hypothetical protein